MFHLVEPGKLVKGKTKALSVVEIQSNRIDLGRAYSHYIQRISSAMLVIIRLALAEPLSSW